MHSMSDEFTVIQKAAAAVIPVITAITLHEAAHGYVADKLGDPTARQLGRITANPIPHIDPIGTILIPGAMALFGGPIFGWAKPVPVFTNRLRRPIRDMGIVAAAGPASNFIMMMIWMLGWKLQITYGLHDFVGLMCQFGVLANMVLGLFNLLPIPPLDGGRILVAVLPRSLGKTIAKVEPYGMMILIGFIVWQFQSGGNLLGSVILAGHRILFSLFNIPINLG